MVSWRSIRLSPWFFFTTVQVTPYLAPIRGRQSEAAWLPMDARVDTHHIDPPTHMALRLTRLCSVSVTDPFSTVIPWPWFFSIATRRP